MEEKLVNQRLQLSSPQSSEEAYEVVVMTASAGGVNALGHVMEGLPAHFSVPIVIVQHLEPTHPSLMVDILNRRTALEVVQAKDGQRLEAGKAYLAPPNYHVLVTADHTLALSQSPSVNFVRPSADVLFKSVAQCYGNRAIAVVLTGSGKDGAKGIQAIKQQGGTVIAQDQESSDFFSMPQAAIDTGAVDVVLPLLQIAPTLINLVTPGGLE